MPSEHIVVDGSNVATEGRNAPSLAQLEEAVGELKREFPEAEVTVIVDATFAHRIEASELERFEQAALAGEYVYPPAGAIGRGDAFLLRIAQKIDAVVLSNDSFQEFHGEHPWLFDRGRLLGATPVPGVGWIFTPRTPVRGPRSRRAVRDTDKARRQVSKAIEAATKEAVSPPKAVSATGRGAGSGRSRRLTATTGDGKAAEVEAAAKGGGGRRGGGRGALGGTVAAAVNDPLTFVSFIAEHPLGKEVTGRVDSYTSHGAVVFAGSVQCYVPLANLGDPPPRSARAVLKRNEERTFVVTALDPLRRGVELALPGLGEVSGRPSEEMIAAEVKLGKKKAAPAKKAAAPAGPRKKAAAPSTKAGAAPAKAGAAAKKADGAAAKAAKKADGGAAKAAKMAAGGAATKSAAGGAGKKSAASAPAKKSAAAVKTKAPGRSQKKGPGAAGAATPVEKAASTRKKIGSDGNPSPAKDTSSRAGSRRRRDGQEQAAAR